jgi:hypothetical protein
LGFYKFNWGYGFQNHTLFGAFTFENEMAALPILFAKPKE